MKKKIIVLGMAVVMLFSVVGLGGCSCSCLYMRNIRELEMHRQDARHELMEFAENLYFWTESHFGIGTPNPMRNHISGPAIDRIVADGKQAITNASDKESVDLALSNTKNEIMTIPLVFRQAFNIGSHHMMVLFPHENVVFEISVDYGGLDQRHYITIPPPLPQNLTLYSRLQSFPWAEGFLWRTQWRTNYHIWRNRDTSLDPQPPYP